jgi:glucose/mannose-6-phosphate isomerase
MERKKVVLSERFAKKSDKRGVWRAYSEWPTLAEKGYRSRAELPRRRFEKACVIGMGGSASGGDILSGWMACRGGHELFVWKGGPLTRNLENTLALACSASGQTEETIEMVKTAVARGATVVSISSGGTLMKVSEELGLQHVMMPEVLAPRYMLPFVIFSCLSVLERGLNLGSEDEAHDALHEMGLEGARLNPKVGPNQNPSKELALQLLNRAPAIYGTTVTRGVGMRFKNVLNENAKRHAYFDGVPDTFHNEIEAWEDPSNRMAPVFLRHSEDGTRDAARMDKMFGLLETMKMRPLKVSGSGKSSLAQLVTMVYRLDMASYYLALATGVDPFPTPLIERMKG